MIQVKGYAAQKAKGILAPYHFERRDVGPHDVQMEILYCGVCYSDITNIESDLFPGIFPMVPGHEIVGRIVKVGDHAKKFKIGDFAGVGTYTNSCRECEECKHGHEVFCAKSEPTYNAKDKNGNPTYGGYSNAIVVDEDFALRVSAKLDLAATTPLLCAGVTTFTPLRKWKVGKGHRLAVVGLGGLGHMA